MLQSRLIQVKIWRLAWQVKNIKTEYFQIKTENRLGILYQSNRKNFKRKLNNTQDSHVNLMVGTEPLMNTLSHKIGERIFLLCDQCRWAVTCINKKYLEELSEISEVEYSCPICKQDQLSSFPITSNNTFRYRYSKNKGLEITFTIKWNSRSALLLKFNWHTSFHSCKGQLRLDYSRKSGSLSIRSCSLSLIFWYLFFLPLLPRPTIFLPWSNGLLDAKNKV